jgi:hypothetical protein
MNTSSLKTFAQGARRKLRQQVGMRLDYWLGSDSAEHRQFAPQIRVLGEALRAEGREGLIERVAYTWFNRLAALRYMDANGFHSFGARVITPATEQQTLPELLQQARGGNLEKELRVHLPSEETFDGILSGAIPVGHPEAEALRLLIFAVCHYYHGLMPFLFEPLGDATELLLPADLLSEHSIIADFRENLPDADCLEVEVIGWLYQFYIAERKDAVMARKSAVPTEDIPAVTQLFTPHWIVRYLVENSLGRLWLLNRPASRLREKMPYYIEGEAETDFLKITKPEDIRLCDPAVGSGHMLTYAFDLLYLIYEEEGYDAPEIPSLILRHNLYGLEICPRAAALAAFALTMKARSRDTRFFRRLATGGAGAPVPQVIELQDIRFAENELGEYIRALDLGALFQQPVLKLLHQFEEAKNFGSLIQPCLDEPAIADLRRAIEVKELGGQLFLRETHLKVLRVLEQAEALTQRYHVVVANPPYMGGKFFAPPLKSFVNAEFGDAKADLYACFILRNLTLCLPAGLVGMITIPNWMFLSSFSQMRKRLFVTARIESLVHNGRGIWGSDFGSCSFVLQNSFKPTHRGTYRRLFEKAGSVASNEELQARFFNVQPHFACSKDFEKLPGEIVAYWISDAERKAFAASRPFEAVAEARQGLATADDNRFLRLWYEVGMDRLGLRFPDSESALKSGRRWFPFNKGGAFRRWYGNNEYVVDWEGDGRDLKAFRPRSVIRNEDAYFLSGVTWSLISISSPSFRLFDPGFIIGHKGPGVFTSNSLTAVLSLLNSNVISRFLSILSPAVGFEVGQIRDLPYSEPGTQVSENANELVALARTDWDNFETSWDFRDLPLLREGLKGTTLELSWRNWEAHCGAAIRRMQELETENNRLFIAAFGLEGELQPEVPDEQITLARAEARRDMAAFLSYAVGCMMGRYSLDRPGLILADAGDTLREFEEKVGKPLGEVSFVPDEDGIIPVLGGEWFGDDIVARVREFVRVVYGEGGLGENVKFIEASLGKDLRKYFAGQFYKDHVQTYKKRPIYWMVSSPEGSFEALIYLHRYTKDTLNVMLDRYVRGFIDKLEERQRQLTELSHDETKRAKERTDAQKEAAVVQRMVKELREWDRAVVLPLAQQRIELDLDDGVKVNYQKFPGLLVKIPGLEKKEEE